MKDTRFLDESAYFAEVYGTDARDRTESAAQGRAPSGAYAAWGKRALDVALVMLGLPFVLPVMLVVALLIKLEGGPIFYSQPRLGRDGRVFRFWKFRTMCVDSDARLARHLAECPEAAGEWRVSQKLRNDPRVTRMGRFLRKSSLDELPQLWNVVIGDMSLVGPRPMMPDQRPLYPGRHYEQLRPGLTGFWQVSERNQVSFAERARFDSRYFREMGLWADIKVLWQTVGVVVRASGC